jgi:hypothetical protein
MPGGSVTVGVEPTYRRHVPLSRGMCLDDKAPEPHGQTNMISQADTG